MDDLILEKRSRTIDLDGRRFVLREMGAEMQRRYLDSLMAAGREIRARARGESVSGDAQVALAAEADLGMAIIMDILREPVDPALPADSAFIAGLSYRQCQDLFRIQDELNGTQELLKNLQSLLA